MLTLRNGAIFLAIFLAVSAAPAEQTKGRVFTNEDIQRSEPAPAPAEKKPAPKEASPEAKSDQAPATAAPEPGAVPAAAAPAAPRSELQKAQDFHAILQQNFDDISESAKKETDARKKQVLDRMVLGLISLIKDNDILIKQLQASSDSSK